MNSGKLKGALRFIIGRDFRHEAYTVIDEVARDTFPVKRFVGSTKLSNECVATMILVNEPAKILEILNWLDEVLGDTEGDD